MALVTTPAAALAHPGHAVADWTQQHPAVHPDARFTQLVTDPASYNVLLFGGTCCAFAGIRTDTWTWNGTDWTSSTPPTPCPSNYRMPLRRPTR
jgi:hypothetical protein